MKLCQNVRELSGNFQVAVLCKLQKFEQKAKEKKRESLKVIHDVEMK